MGEMKAQTSNVSLTMTRVKSLKEGGEFCEEINMMLFRSQTHTEPHRY